MKYSKVFTAPNDYNPLVKTSILCCHLLLLNDYLTSLENIFIIFEGEIGNNLFFWKIPPFTIYHLLPILYFPKY